ncbi:hypothetical protein GCM10009765_41690 [Fodinicola feengrottensis]|uniref:PA14 domain-containing protein n=1 Tax=Fodinicola feengrottensis TaxID=435914 RepID=A0ABP4TH35_9ACTN
MRKTIARTLTISALLALPFAGATAASAAPAHAQPSAAGINAISGNWARDLQADDGPNFDQLTVKKNGSIRLGGQPDNLYDCTGSVRATGNNHYLFSLRCLSAGEVYYQKAKAEYSPKHRALTIHMGRTETFHR